MKTLIVSGIALLRTCLRATRPSCRAASSASWSMLGASWAFSHVPDLQQCPRLAGVSGVALLVYARQGRWTPASAGHWRRSAYALV